MARAVEIGRWATALLAAILLAPTVAGACAVCYGAPESAMTLGMNNAILTLLAVVGALQAALIALFVGFWRRSRRVRVLEGVHHIQGGT